MLARRLTYELSNAALNSSGGSTPNSTMSGLSSMLGIHGTKERARPATTSTNGEGSLNLRAAAAIAIAATTNIKTVAPDKFGPPAFGFHSADRAPSTCQRAVSHDY